MSGQAVESSDEVIHLYCRKGFEEQKNCPLDVLVFEGDLMVVCKHHATRGHDRCWENDRELYRAAGLLVEGPDLPPRAEFLKRCEAYYEQQDQGNS